jgi:hypothetical protein
MCPAELGMSLFGKTGMRLDKVFFRSAWVIHDILLVHQPDCTIISIAKLLPRPVVDYKGVKTMGSESACTKRKQLHVFQAGE